MMCTISRLQEMRSIPRWFGAHATEHKKQLEVKDVEGFCLKYYYSSPG